MYSREQGSYRFGQATASSLYVGLLIGPSNAQQHQHNGVYDVVLEICLLHHQEMLSCEGSGWCEERDRGTQSVW